MTTEFDSRYTQYQIRRSSLRRAARVLYLRRAAAELRGPTLDFGCGVGELLERLPQGSKGVEYNHASVEHCRHKGLPVEWYDGYADDWSLHALPPGLLTRTILRIGERFIYRRADRVLVTNEQMSQYVSQVAGTDVSARTIVVDHGVDSVHFAPRPPDEELRAQHRLSDRDTVVLFLGTTYAFSGLTNLVRRMPIALQQCPSLKLVIVGGGDQDRELAMLVDELGLAGHVVLTGMVSYQEVPRYLSMATLALNPFELNAITRDIIPIKILQYQAAALPVLSTPLPDLVRKHRPGISGVEYSGSDDPDAFLAKMMALLADPVSLRAIGRRGLNFVNGHFSVDRAVDCIEATLS